MGKSKIFTKITAVILSLIVMIGITAPSFAAADTTQPPADTEEVVETVSIPEAVVEIARSKIGYYPSNINEFTTWYYGRETDAYWCCIFVSWCADQAGALGTAVPKRASVGSMKNWFERRGEFYPVDSDYVPQKGDIVFINTAVDGTDDIHHVDIITEDGFIKSGSTLKIKCIGGNTSDINYNGSEYVTEKTRPVDGPRAQVVGYAHPSYENSDGLIGAIYTAVGDSMPNIATYLISKLISLINIVETLLANQGSSTTPPETTTVQQ